MAKGRGVKPECGKNRGISLNPVRVDGEVDLIGRDCSVNYRSIILMSTGPSVPATEVVLSGRIEHNEGAPAVVSTLYALASPLVVCWQHTFQG